MSVHFGTNVRSTVTSREDIWALPLGESGQPASQPACGSPLSVFPPQSPVALERPPAKIPIPSRLAQEIQSQLETQGKQGTHRHLIEMKNVEAQSCLET